MEIKHIGISAIAAMLCLSAVSCGNSSSSSSTAKSSESTSVVSEKTSESGETTTAEAEEDTTKAKSEAMPTALTDDLLDYRFSIDGEIIALPCTLGQFTDNGWDYQADLTKTELRSHDRYSVTLKKDGKQMSASIYNNSKERIDLTSRDRLDEISVREIHCFAEYNPDSTILLPKGIKLGSSTKSELIAAYGEPQDKEKFEGMESYYYYKEKDIEDYKQVKCRFCLCLDAPTDGSSSEKIAHIIDMAYYE